MESKQCGGIDLHIHSTASDGTLSPSEILKYAAHLGLRAIAITDHDTLDGSRQALECEIAPTLRLLTGVEISAQPPDGFGAGGGSLHILGYGVDPQHQELLQTLNKFQKVRDDRTRRMVKRLNQVGIELTLDQVMAEVGGGAASRPHVASAMIKAGIVSDVDEAFQKYLGKGRPAYVGKERLDCHQTFELIHAAGGIPVLAHPFLIPSQNNNELAALVASLCRFGLKGLEVYYPAHSPQTVNLLLSLAEKHGLLATGGSDFHGGLTPDIEMGRGAGDLHVPYALFEKMIADHPLKFI